VLPSLGRVFVIGKEGVGYLLTAGALGGVGRQVASRRICSGAWGGTAWVGSLVFLPCADGLYAVSVTASSITVAWRAPRPTLSPPIVAAGALWGVDAGSATLYAFDPATGKTLLSMGIGGANRYSTPAATEGFVVVPAGRHVIAVSVVS
jgi:outer membrane protein assembly factor BamB